MGIRPVAAAWRRGIVCTVTLAISLGCSPRKIGDAETPDALNENVEVTITWQRLRILTYNVAGLPAKLSSSEPDKNTHLMSPLLNRYQLALVQEDFSYHPELASAADHPHQSEPSRRSTLFGLGDGLNRFSSLVFQGFERHPWTHCHGRFSDGSDCFTKQGFTVAQHRLGPGAWVDVYNVHLDAGHSSGDRVARAHQVEQLLSVIISRSAGAAVIVAGDTNLGSDDGALLLRLQETAGLTDSCRVLQCAESRIDRVLFRSSSELQLRALSYRVDEKFRTSDGRDLSDHQAIGVQFGWAAAPSLRAELSRGSRGEPPEGAVPAAAD